MLRRLECALPIELWHMGPAEMPAGSREPLQRLGVDIVDAFEVRREQPVRCLGGYELKAFALAHTRFTEVLLLDADNVPVVDPSLLFETPQFAARGAIFWPDYGMSRPVLATGALSRTHPIWALTGVAFRGEREFESGQICVDRRRCLRDLVLALWLNEHSDFWYRYLWGDKDTIHLASRKLEREWAMPARGPIDLSGLAMAQCDFEGRIIFIVGYSDLRVHIRPDDALPRAGFAHPETEHREPVECAVRGQSRVRLGPLDPSGRRTSRAGV